MTREIRLQRLKAAREDSKFYHTKIEKTLHPDNKQNLDNDYTDRHPKAPFGYKEEAILRLFAANPTREWSASEVAERINCYRSNAYDPLNNLVRKNKISVYMYPTGRKLWRYKS